MEIALLEHRPAPRPSLRQRQSGWKSSLDGRSLGSSGDPELSQKVKETAARAGSRRRRSSASIVSSHTP